MRSHCRPGRFARALLLLGTIVAAAMLFTTALSCSGENSETILEVTDTVTIRDTVFSTDTLYDDTLIDTLPFVYTDTVFADTLVDTLFLPEGRSQQLFYGLVYDLSQPLQDSTDSVYLGLTCFSNPMREDLLTSVNDEDLPLEEGQREYVMYNSIYDATMGQIFPAVNSMALLDGTLYEGHTTRASSYDFQIVVPQYNLDSAGPVTYDTIEASVSVPEQPDSIVVAVGATSPALVTDDSLVNFDYYLVPGDSAIDITWQGTADFYVVSIYKYILSPYGGVYVAGTPLDTIKPGTSFSIPRGYLAFDTSDAAQDYDVAEIDIIPVNGPVPSSWDTMPSFGGRGLLLALDDEFQSALLVPDDGFIAAGKRMAAAQAKARPPAETVEAVLERYVSNR